MQCYALTQSRHFSHFTTDKMSRLSAEQLIPQAIQPAAGTSFIETSVGTPPPLLCVSPTAMSRRRPLRASGPGRGSLLSLGRYPPCTWTRHPPPTLRVLRPALSLSHPSLVPPRSSPPALPPHPPTESLSGPTWQSVPARKCLSLSPLPPARYRPACSALRTSSPPTLPPTRSSPSTHHPPRRARPQPV